MRVVLARPVAAKVGGGVHRLAAWRVENGRLILVPRAAAPHAPSASSSPTYSANPIMQLLPRYPLLTPKHNCTTTR